MSINIYFYITPCSKLNVIHTITPLHTAFIADKKIIRLDCLNSGHSDKKQIAVMQVTILCNVSHKFCDQSYTYLKDLSQFTGSFFFVQQRSFWKSICIYCPFNMPKQLFIKIGPFAVNSKRIVPMYFQWDYLRIDAKFTILKYKSPVIIFK